jgi:hypothetical protein
MSKPIKDDDGYPFDTGHWASWTNVKRRDWMRNFRDRMLDEGSTTHYLRYGFTEADMQQIVADTAAYEKVVADEQAARHQLSRVKTPQDLIAYIAWKQQRWVANGSDMADQPRMTPEEGEHIKKLFTDVKTADAFIQAIDFYQAQLKQEYNATALSLMDILDKNGKKGTYLTPSDILGNKGN